MAVERRGWYPSQIGSTDAIRRNPRIWTKAIAFLDGKSRMSREAHVRFRERPGVKLPRPTRHSIWPRN